MPLWILYSLIAAAAIAFTSVIDKAVLSNWMTKPTGSYFVFGAIEALSGFAALAILGFPRLPLAPLLVTLAAGAAFAASSLCYFQAVKVEEISRVVPLYDLTPVIVAILAAGFLHEVLSPVKYLGVLLISGGAILLSLKRLRGFRFGKGMAWMLLSVGLVAVGVVAIKFALDSLDPWAIFAYSKLGTLFATVPFMREGYGVFRSSVRTHGARVLVATLVSEGVTSVTTIFILFAASTGYITLVNAVVGTNPLFLLLLTVLISVYRPAILREELNRKLLLRKLVAIACMILGTWLVA